MSAVIGLHLVASKCQTMLATFPISLDRAPRSSNFCIFGMLFKVEFSAWCQREGPLAGLRPLNWPAKYEKCRLQISYAKD